MKITIGIVARNEELFLPLVLNDLLKQTYSLELIEVILIDGVSSDNTIKVMENFKTENEHKFYKIKIITNEKKIQSCGWNLVFSNFETDAVFRIDAHGRIDKSFVQNAVEKFKQGYKVVGGIRKTISYNDGRIDRVLLNAENSLFGCSISDARHNTKPKKVKSLFHAGYLREVIDETGFFNEKLGRTEDNEFHYRIRKCGYDIYMFNDIISYQYIRMNFRKDLKQKFMNGLWIGRTLFFCPKCLSLYHFIPFVFVIGIITTCACIPFTPIFAIMLGILYLSFSIINTMIISIKGKKTIFNLFLPFVFLFLHISYGIGTLIGLINPKIK